MHAPARRTLDGRAAGTLSRGRAGVYGSPPAMATEPYLPADLPPPVVTPDNREWWEACRRRELVFQRCASCGTLRHPPTPVCHRCHSFAHGWQPSAGAGRVYSFTWVHHVYLPSLAGRIPYDVSVVTLDDAPGVRLITNVVDATPADLRIDLPVRLLWEEVGDFVLPRFRKG